MNPDEIAFLGNSIERELKDAKSDLLEKHPIEDYIKLLGKYPDLAKYNYVSSEVLEFCNKIVADTDERILEKYHKLLLVVLIGKNRNEIGHRILPNEIKERCGRSFERIVRQIENNIEMPGPYNYPEDFFFKDLSICTLRMIPVGATTYEFSRFPGRNLLNRAVLRKDIKQFMQVIGFMVFELKGQTVPFIESHLVSHDPVFHDDLSLEGVTNNRRLVAQWVRMDKNIKGSYGVSWFVDPQIAIISPRHAYVHTFMRSTGYKFFYYGLSEIAIKHAVSTSKTRKNLYREGKYVPTNYLTAISRKRLLSWADKMK